MQMIHQGDADVMEIIHGCRATDLKHAPVVSELGSIGREQAVGGGGRLLHARGETRERAREGQREREREAKTGASCRGFG